ncbi:hypothetical protein EYF80_003983 [Liparis tanakae]|uniref:Uncharacterized protein n=1 Tax=Liparis tanakae TaxID=230148 RepID=A0A4Z2J6C4_9TELE|nr:hypothetical protein EYF80_003983 [Liparis tanakae]
MAALQVLQGHVSDEGAVVQLHHSEALLATGTAAQSSDAIICDQLAKAEQSPVVFGWRQESPTDSQCLSCGAVRHKGPHAAGDRTRFLPVIHFLKDSETVSNEGGIPAVSDAKHIR